MSTYREQHRAPGWMRILGGIVAVGSAAFLAATVAQIPPHDATDSGVAIVALTVGLALGIAALTQSLSIRADATAIRVRLTPFYWRTIPVAEIDRIEASWVNPARYAGVGIRRAPGQPPAVFQAAGPAALITLRRGGQLLLQCSAPEKLQRLVAR